MDTILLHNQHMTARIRPAGAQIVSLQDAAGREIIWQADPKIWADRAPVLFPVIGTPLNGSVIINGVTYPMPKHGVARRAMFTVIEATDDSVTLRLTESAETLASYPFAFALDVTFTLLEAGFRCIFAVTNRSDVPMPFCVGGHPAFIVPMQPGEAFEEYQVVFPEDEVVKNALVPNGVITGYEMLTFPGGRLNLDHAIFDEKDTILMPELRSRHVDLVHRDTGRGLRFAFENMEVLALWSHTHTHGDYLCIEPWHGMPGIAGESGEFEKKPYATVLQPGERYDCCFQAELI